MEYTLDTNALRNLSELFLSPNFIEWHTENIRNQYCLPNETHVSEKEVINYWSLQLKNKLCEKNSTINFNPMVCCELIKHLNTNETPHTQKICFYALCIMMNVLLKENQQKGQYLFDEKLCLHFFGELPNAKSESPKLLHLTFEITENNEFSNIGNFDNKIKEVTDYISNIKQDFIDNMIDSAKRMNNGNIDLYCYSKNKDFASLLDKEIEQKIVVKQLYNRACKTLHKNYDDTAANSFIGSFNKYFLEWSQIKLKIIRNLRKEKNQTKELDDVSHKYWNDYIDMMILFISNIGKSNQVLVTAECGILKLKANKDGKAIIHFVEFLSDIGFSQNEIDKFYELSSLPKNNCFEK